MDKQGAKHALRSAEHKTLHEKVELTRLELDNLQNTLKQLEHFVEKIKGEIALSRRATYVGEEIVLKAEKEKKEQDYLIDLLQQRIKHLHEKQALLKAQLSGLSHCYLIHKKVKASLYTNEIVSKFDSSIELLIQTFQIPKIEKPKSLLFLTNCDHQNKLLNI